MDVSGLCSRRAAHIEYVFCLQSIFSCPIHSQIPQRVCVSCLFFCELVGNMCVRCVSVVAYVRAIAAFVEVL